MDIYHHNKYKKDFWTRLSTAVQFVNNGLYGLMATNGDIVLEAKYDHIEICSDFVYAHYGTRHKFIYKNGGESDCADSEDEHQFYENGKVGLKDNCGKILIPPQYDEVYEWGDDSDVIYVRRGKEFHYYNHNLEEILTDVDVIEEDTEPECPYSIYEDQNRNVMLCVEPISVKEGNRDCFAYGQWVRLSRIRCKDVRNLFSHCKVVNIPLDAIEQFEDRHTYIYSARIYKCKGELPIMSCIEKFKTLGCYDSSWYYLLKISTNRNTAINPHDLYGVIKHFEDIEYDECIRFDIAIDYDDTLEDGTVQVMQIHYFWDDMGEFLHDSFRQTLLEEGTKDEIKTRLNKMQTHTRNQMLSVAYWWIGYSEKRDWKETEYVLDYLFSEGSTNATMLIERHLQLNPYWIEDVSEAEWHYKEKIINWAISKGGQLNYIHNGKTLYEEFLANLKEAIEMKNEDNDSKASINNAERFAIWLKEHGAITAAEQRKQITSKIDGLLPEEVIKIVHTI